MRFNPFVISSAPVPSVVEGAEESVKMSLRASHLLANVAISTSDLVKDKINIQNCYFSIVVQIAIIQCLSAFMAIDDCL
jgi:hypothetical protein